MSKCRLAVLFGGCSPEYRVSLQSAHGVLTHLDPQKYEPVPLGITQDGRWFLYTGPYDALPDDTWHLGPCCVPAVLSPDRELHGLLLLNAAGPSTLRLDAALPVLHGRNGEDGTVQGLLELAGIPVAGCGVLSSALCMDKELAHQVARASGVEVPRSVVFRAGEDFVLLRQRTAALSWPLFVKPARAGSSFGVTRVTANPNSSPPFQPRWSETTKWSLRRKSQDLKSAVPYWGTGTSRWAAPMRSNSRKAFSPTMRNTISSPPESIRLPESLRVRNRPCRRSRPNSTARLTAAVWHGWISSLRPTDG